MRHLGRRLLLFAIRVLPRRSRQRVVKRLARGRYRRSYPGTRPQAANLRERLGVAPDEAEELLQRWFELELRSLGRSLPWRPAGVARRIELRGLTNLETALAQKRGAMVVGGHFHELTLFLASLGAAGYRPCLIRIVQPEPSSRLDGWLRRSVERRLRRRGCSFLWMQSGSLDAGVRSLNALRKNALLVSPVDLTQTHDNAVVEFLGARGHFPRGVAILAKAAGAPMLEFTVHVEGDDTVVAEIGEPFPVEDVDAAMQVVAARLERHVWEHPVDWSPWHVFDDWRARDRERERERSPGQGAPIAGA